MNLIPSSYEAVRDKARYILDSSIWVDIERGDAQLIRRAEPLILKNRVCLVDLIVAELLRGARSDADYAGLKLRLESFRLYSTPWEQVARLAYLVRRAGFQPPLTDLYIAQCAIEHKRVLVTRDKHFAQIASVKSFRLEEW